MTLRTPRERAVQVLCFEAGGLLVAVPLYALASGEDAGRSALLIAALSVAVMAWSPIHNTLFDVAELRWAGRVASDRPHRWRAVHALSHEASALLVTLPIVMGLTGLGLGGALLVEAGLTALYAGYAYAFHWGFDRLRPVAGPLAGPVAAPVARGQP